MSEIEKQPETSTRAFTEELDLKCEVCSKPAVGVCNALGPVSCAFCKECLMDFRVPYWNLVGYLGFPPPEKKEDLAEWVHPYIDHTLAYYEKSWEDFVKDCTEANEKLDMADIPDIGAGIDLDDDSELCPTCRAPIDKPHEEGCPEAGPGGPNSDVNTLRFT